LRRVDKVDKAIFDKTLVSDVPLAKPESQIIADLD
jgi:hypothetical protein